MGGKRTRRPSHISSLLRLAILTDLDQHLLLFLTHCLYYKNSLRSGIVGCWTEVGYGQPGTFRRSQEPDFQRLNKTGEGLGPLHNTREFLFIPAPWPGVALSSLGVDMARS